MMSRAKSATTASPAAALEVEGASGPMRLAVGGESRQVELRGNDSLVITGTAKDSRGIKDIALQGNAVVTCSDPATGATFTRTTGFLRRHVPGTFLRGSPPSQRDSRFVLRVGDIARLCPGEHLESAVGQARLQASNYRGDAASTPHLEFRIAVGEAAARAIPMPGTPGALARRSASATGFTPEGGVGGSGSQTRSGTAASSPAVSAPAVSAPLAPMTPRMCPRSAAPGRSAERRATGDATPRGECLDTPVPSLSPPIGAGPPTSRVSSPRGGSQPGISPLGVSPAGSQRSQIHRT
jgi:hypothetical protein